MWQVILQILSIIGIILLVLLLALILLLCFVLFIPIRYKVKGNVDTEQKKYSGKGQASWFFHILSVYAAYPETPNILVKIFGYPIKRIDFSAEETDQTGEPTEEKEAEEVRDEEELDSSEKENKRDNISSQESKDEILNQEENSKESLVDRQEACKTKDKVKVKTQEKWYQKILYTIKDLCDKIKEVWNNIQYYKDVLGERQNRLFFERSKKRIYKLMKAIAPKRIKGHLVVGTGSPDTTGYVLGIYGMIYPFLDKNFNLEPDFETDVCKGEIEMKGRIYLSTVVLVVLQFVTDKQLPVLLKKLKREER